MKAEDQIVEAILKVAEELGIVEVAQAIAQG